MELKQFQGLALRTESQIQGIKLNRSNLITLLKVVVVVAEILDGIKKATFYNKTAKLEDGLPSNLIQLMQLVQELQWSTQGRGPLGATMDANETMENIDPRVFHGILGIITESGELAAALLKSVEDPNHTVDAVNVQEEMSDIAWYKAILHDTLKLDWGQGLDNVINKLRIRYPDKYSDEAADNRDLDAERAALEVGVTTPELRHWPLPTVTFDPVKDDTHSASWWSVDQSDGTVRYETVGSVSPVASGESVSSELKGYISGKFDPPQECQACGEPAGSCCPSDGDN